MRHNKTFGWESFLEVVERVQKVSPWLSRQIAKRASEWPFWPSGVQIKEWRENQVWVGMPCSFRNSVEGEITQGHMLLAGELVIRLLLLRYRQEFPFRYRIVSSKLETHHAVDQAVDIKFAISFDEWERVRLELARDSRSLAEFAFSAALEDGRLAASFTLQVAFDLEKFLPA
jgi:hypothetical protein